MTSTISGLYKAKTGNIDNDDSVKYHRIIGQIKTNQITFRALFEE